MSPEISFYALGHQGVGEFGDGAFWRPVELLFLHVRQLAVGKIGVATAYQEQRTVQLAIGRRLGQ